MRALIYITVGVAEAGYMGLVPVLPSFAREFELSELEAGALVAAAGLSMAVASPLSGSIADRFGARRATALAAAVLVLPTLAQPFAPSFTILLGVRLIMGMGLALAWVGGAAWLAQAAPAGRVAPWVGGLVAWVSVGIAIGPPLTGLMVETLGFDSPFIATAAGLAVLSMMLARLDTPLRTQTQPCPERALLAAIQTPQIAVAAGVLAMSAVSLTGISVLVPLGLGEHGFSAAGIGTVFGVGAVVFTGASLWVSRHGSALATTPMAFAGCAALALSMLPAVASQAPLWIVTMMVVSAPARALVSTIALPLALDGARRRGVPDGATMGFMNAVWAASTVVGPLFAGVFSEPFGLTAGYAFIFALTLLTTFAIAASGRSAAREVAPSGEQSGPRCDGAGT